MKATTKAARNEIKKLINAIGIDNILNKHITEIVNKTGCSYFECQNAMSYWQFRKTR